MLRVPLLSAVMHLRQNVLACEVVLEEVEEQLRFFLPFLGAEESLVPFLIHGGDDVVVTVGLKWYYRGLLLEK